MSRNKLTLFEAVATMALCAACALPARAATAADSPGTAVGEVVVTAQKRQENIQNVAMSIQAATGDDLLKLGVSDPAQLQKIVPGFYTTPTAAGTTVFTIRGVGFQDSSLAGSPTVTVYVDESPLPFTAMTAGASLDLQRVEVLKGPQGTLFGENATGGAINYVANKPTDAFHAGADLSYGRFNAVDLQGFVSGPITDTLDVRLALRTNQSDAWQKSYAPQEGQTSGGAEFYNGRFSILWKPTSDLKALLTLEGWQDRGVTQMPQRFGASAQASGALDPLIANFPNAPHNDQAADFNSCLNTNVFASVVGHPATSLGMEQGGPGSALWAGAQPTQCVNFRKNNTFYGATLRVDYALPYNMTLTSLSSYHYFSEFTPLDLGGMNIIDEQDLHTGHLGSAYQELRLAGKFEDRGNWIVGANYEYDNTYDHYFSTLGASTENPSTLPFSSLCGVFGGCSPAELAEPAVLQFPLATVASQTATITNTYAAYASGDYMIIEGVTLEAGLRYTQEDKRYQGCSEDSGDGSGDQVNKYLENLREVLGGAINLHQYLAGGGFGVDVGPGACPEGGPAPLYLPANGGALISSRLDQDNVSWRTGVKWKLTPIDMVYFNVSQGWKGGSFPTIPSTNSTELLPVVQESLLAYEGGFKLSLLDRTLKLDGAAFYYDYTNKQILGDVFDPVFGPLTQLINIPQSHVVGFEVSGAWNPTQIPGLTISPSLSYQSSRVDSSSKNSCIAAAGGPGFKCVPGHFYNYDAFGEYADFTGEKFPDAPEWQATIDAEYDWKVLDDMTAFFGVNANYTDSTDSFFVNRTPDAGDIPLSIPSHILVDLRAGVSRGNWSLQFWGRNVTDAWYWNNAFRDGDGLLRYTGMPATYGATFHYRY
jgi:iron complex outermembrane recepter protein